MVRKKKSFLKKTGCILISVSIVLMGSTFFGSSISEADLDADFQIEEPTVPTEDTGGAGDNTAGTTEAGQGTETVQGTEEQPIETQRTNATEGSQSENTVTDEAGVSNTTNATGTETAGNTAGDTTNLENTNNTQATTNNSATTTTPAVSENTTEETAGGEDTVNTDELATTSLSMSTFSLFGASSDMLTASLATASTDSEDNTYSDSEATIEGSTLVYVPAGIGSSYTVPDGITTIATNAFSDSNVVYLTFTDASDISSIGSQDDWPSDGTKVYCPNDSADEATYVVSYFNSLITADRNIEIIFDEEEEKNTYTITVYDSLYDTDGTTLIETVVDKNNLSGDYEEGATITAGSIDGYTLFGNKTATVTGEDVVFTYKKNATTTKYSVTVYKALYDTDGKTLLDTQTDSSLSGSYEAGATISAGSVSGYTLFGSSSYSVTSTDNQKVTFTYKKNGSDVKTYPVTVYEAMYDSAGTKITATNTSTLSGNYLAGATITARTISNYTLFDTSTYTVTTGANQSVTFKYKASSSNNGEGGGGNSGGGSSSGGSSSSTTVATGTVSDTAKTTQSYHIIEGAGQIVGKNDGTVKIVCDGPVDKLAYILMDGNIVDKGNYTIQSGSTILTFTANYVASLAEGDHAVQFQYTDGYAVTGLRITNGATKTTTTVTYKVSSDGSISSGHTKDTTPKTADGFDNRYLLCLGIFLLGAGAILLSRQKKLEAILAGEEEDE